MESVSTCEKCVCIFTFFFLNLNMLTHLENETFFLKMRDICDVKLKEKIEGERSKEILNFQIESDDTMQLIMKKYMSKG